MKYERLERNGAAADHTASKRGRKKQTEDGGEKGRRSKTFSPPPKEQKYISYISVSLTPPARAEKTQAFSAFETRSVCHTKRGEWGKDRYSSPAE